MTYRELFQKQSQIARNLNKEESAVKLLIKELSNFSPNDLYFYYNDEIPTAIEKRILEALDLYFYQNKPIQYILGYTYFYGLKLKVNNNVLIPRPETELLVDIVLKNVIKKDNLKILDIGCGSGAISLALKKELPNADITGIDISNEALLVALENSKINKLDIKLFQSNLFENVKEKYDIIVSNPPYIGYDEEVDQLVLQNEPHTALFAENEGLFFYQEILKTSSKYLNENNLVVFEIPIDKERQLQEMINLNYPHSEYEIYKDFNNRQRVLIIKNNWR